MFGKAKKLGLALAAITGAAVGGAAIAGAATSGNGTATAGPSRPAPPGMRKMPAPGTAAHEAAEKPVTGEAAAKAQAAAVKAAGGGTAGDVTTDYFGNGYEVTVTQSDGTSREYHLDSNFDVMPPPPNGLGAPPKGAPPAGTSS